MIAILYVGILIYLMYHFAPIVLKWLLIALAFPFMPFLMLRDEEWKKEYPIGSKLVLATSIIFWIVMLSITLLVIFVVK